MPLYMGPGQEVLSPFGILGFTLSNLPGPEESDSEDIIVRLPPLELKDNSQEEKPE